MIAIAINATGITLLLICKTISVLCAVTYNLDLRQSKGQGEQDYITAMVWSSYIYTRNFTVVVS